MPSTRREQRVLSLRLVPALTNHLHRERHRVRRLMTGHAASAVRADGLEEGMVLRSIGAGGVQHADLAKRVGVRRQRRTERRALAGRPPASRRRASTSAQRGAVAPDDSDRARGRRRWSMPRQADRWAHSPCRRRRAARGTSVTAIMPPPARAPRALSPIASAASSSHPKNHIWRAHRTAAARRRVCRPVALLASCTCAAMYVSSNTLFANASKHAGYPVGSARDAHVRDRSRRHSGRRRNGTASASCSSVYDSCTRGVSVQVPTRKSY